MQRRAVVAALGAALALGAVTAPVMPARAQTPSGGASAAETQANPATLPAVADDERFLELERRLQALSRRIAILEQRTGASDPAQPVNAGGGPVWTFDSYIDDTPFKVTHHALDEARGTVDLLLRVTAPLADKAAWSSAGTALPIGVTLRAADGVEGYAAFALMRATRVEPGAHLHVRATFDPALAAAAGQLLVGRTAPGEQ
ncbi:MAG: hypothetical protein K9L70_02470 [Thiohalocapsa sp.]|nr:hypothetical protein [Thiohalocapsa sp.]MCF7989227.1 hypothetical protein [Thiohalocapsa sp.]